MYQKCGHQHRDEEWNRGEPGEQAQNEKQGAHDLTKHGQAEARCATDTERVGKRARLGAEVGELGPAVADQHHAGHADAQNEKADTVPVALGTCRHAGTIACRAGLRPYDAGGYVVPDWVRCPP